MLMQDYKNLLLKYLCYLNFQPVIVMLKVQVVFHAVILVYALVMQMLVGTNVMLVMQDFLTFLHVQVSIAISHIKCFKTFNLFITN